MNDLISRQAAIDALERGKSLVERPITETRWFDLGLGKAQDVLSELPSAQPERKRGKWKFIGSYMYQYRCTACHKCAEYRTRFCPNCGAEMCK